MAVKIPVSWGDLLDKLTILQIKMERIEDPEKRRNVRKELIALDAVWRDRGVPAQELEELVRQLRQINEQLWDIEDAIRLCERQQEFGARFVQLARSVYQNNDRRAAVKYRINRLLDSDIVEEKSYESY
jgi:hypothetical protein